MSKYVALLRGINVGGNHMIRKDELTAIFERAGFTSVQTLLASGNVVFASDETSEAQLTVQIETAIEEAVGYHVHVMVRSLKRIQEMMDREPFAGYHPSGCKFYVTFLASKPTSNPPLPQDLKDQGSVAVGLDDREFYSIAQKNREGSYGDFSPFLKEHFKGIQVTTRNWNTVLKIAALDT